MENILNNFLLATSLILLSSVLLSKSSNNFGLPILVVFLFLGMIAGSEGLGGIDFDNYELTHSLSLLALCLIIFSGGTETSWGESKKELLRGIVLSSFGIVLTTVIVGCFAHFVAAMSWLDSLLLGAILSATDAAAVFSIFKDKKSQVKSSLRSLIKFESGSNDPMAYLLVTVILGFIEEGITPWEVTALKFLINPLVGLICGWVIAKIFISINNLINLDYLGLYPVLTLAFLFLAYSLSTKFQGNGFLAVYILGMMIGNQKILHKNILFNFYDGISWLAQIGLFVMLGLLVFPSRLIAVAPMGLLIACFLVLVARPLTIALCMFKSRFNMKERFFISWAGLKGATPIVFASFAATHLGEKVHKLFDIVFFVVIVSALLQGSTLKLLARKLGLLLESYEDPNFPVDMEIIEKTKNGITQFTIELGDNALSSRIVDLKLPTGALVLFIKRQKTFIVPDGSTNFELNDRVLLVTKNKEDIEIALECFKHKGIALLA